DWVSIVGVVGDVKEQGLNLPTHLEMYRPYDQAPFPSSLTLMVRTDAEPTALAAVIRQEVWAVDKDVPVADIQPMTQVIYESVAKPRSTMLLLSVFAAIALTLGAIGVYGVIAYTVNRRSHEMGVRMALGATSGDLLKLVLEQGMVLTLAGVVVGLVAS